MSARGRTAGPPGRTGPGPAARRSRRAAGFTLLELMAASTLLALFFVFVFGIVWGTIRTRDSMEQQALPFSTGPVVLQRVVDDLQLADVADVKDNDGFSASSESVAGEDVTRIDFVAAVPSRDRVKIGDEWVRAGVNEVGYRLRRSESADGLLSLYRREDYGVDGDPKEGGKYYKLADRVRRFTIDFFDEDPGTPDGDGSQGETDWDAKQEKRLPWGCRVTLVLVGPASADGDADEDEAEKDYVFQAYVPFRSRFDKAEGKAGGGANPPGGNPPGGNPPGGNPPSGE